MLCDRLLWLTRTADPDIGPGLDRGREFRFATGCGKCVAAAARGDESCRAKEHQRLATRARCVPAAKNHGGVRSTGPWRTRGACRANATIECPWLRKHGC